MDIHPTSTYRWKIPRPTPVPVETTTRQKTARNPFVGIPLPTDGVSSGIQQRSHDPTGVPPANFLPLRTPIPTPTPPSSSEDETLREIISLKNVDLDVYFGYYGICVGSASLPLRCSNKRPKNATDLKRSLFPGAYNDDGSVNTTALTLNKDPQDILSLGVQLQRSLSPAPVICAILAFGAALLTSLFVSVTSGTSYSGVGGANNVLLDKVVLGLTGLGVLLLLMAVSFLKVAGDVAGEILDGVSGGGGGMLLDVAGVQASPGYCAVRIGVAALVMAGGVAAGMAWRLGIGRSAAHDAAAQGGGMNMWGGGGGGGWRDIVGKVTGGRFMGRDVGGPEWKRSIGHPVPVFGHGPPPHVMAAAAYHPPPASALGMHPAFAGQHPSQSQRGGAYV